MLQETKFKLINPSQFGNKSDYFGFCFAGAKEPRDGKIAIIQGTNTCREGMMANMRSSIVKENKELPTDKFRVIWKWTASEKNLKADLKTINDWVNRSIAVLQAFDRIAGWPLTRVYQVEADGRKWLKLYYYHSSRRWMKSSYLVSLYLLLIRMCKDTRITGFKDFNGLVSKLEKILKNDKLLIDTSYVRQSLPYWEAIMKGYPSLFRQRKIQYYWDTDRLSGNSSGGSEGIQMLTNGSTYYKEVRAELLKIQKELNDKKKKK